jgi:hypothetical protein
MSLGADAILVEDSLTLGAGTASYYPRPSLAADLEQPVGLAVQPDRSRPRHTPRRALVVILPENHSIASDAVCAHLAAEQEPRQVDVILACTGHSSSLAALQRRVHDIQVLLAPAGTSTEDLRELAMNQVPGDIVTLLNGTPVVS